MIKKLASVGVEEGSHGQTIYVVRYNNKLSRNSDFMVAAQGVGIKSIEASELLLRFTKMSSEERSNDIEATIDIPTNKKPKHDRYALVIVAKGCTPMLMTTSMNGNVAEFTTIQEAYDMSKKCAHPCFVVPLSNQFLEVIALANKYHDIIGEVFYGLEREITQLKT